MPKIRTNFKLRFWSIYVKILLPKVDRKWRNVRFFGILSQPGCDKQWVQWVASLLHCLWLFCSRCFLAFRNGCFLACMAFWLLKLVALWLALLFGFQPFIAFQLVLLCCFYQVIASWHLWLCCSEKFLLLCFVALWLLGATKQQKPKSNGFQK